MVKISAEDSEMEQLLTSLCDVAVEHGGYIHDELCIECVGGNLSVTAPKTIESGKPLITIPQDGILPLNEIEFRVNGDEVFIASMSEKVNLGQAKMAELMVAIYNATGKIAAQRLCSPDMLFFHDKDLLMRVTGEGFVARCAKREPDQFVLGSFLQSRKLSMKLFSDENPDPKPEPVLMPLIDFFNHHPKAQPFGRKDGNLVVYKTDLDSDDEECYVNYGRHDDHMSFTTYGYVETRSSHVLCRPMRVVVPNVGEIVIRKKPEARFNPQQLPGPLKGLGQFLSPIIFSGDRESLTFSALRIPSPAAPRAMRRILSFYVGNMSGRLKDDELERAVQDIEQRVIDFNHAYYADLIADLADYKAAPGMEMIIDNMKLMARCQLAKIEVYANSRPQT